jgi:hypothetical protein
MFSTIAGKDFPQLCNENHSCADRAHDGSNAGDFGHCEVIRFVAGRCSLDAILGGDDLEAFSRDLRDRFPPARLIEGGDVFASVMAGILDVVENPGARPRSAARPTRHGIPAPGPERCLRCRGSLCGQSARCRHSLPLRGAEEWRARQLSRAGSNSRPFPLPVKGGCASTSAAWPLVIQLTNPRVSGTAASCPEQTFGSGITPWEEQALVGVRTLGRLGIRLDQETALHWVKRRR